MTDLEGALQTMLFRSRTNCRPDADRRARRLSLTLTLAALLAPLALGCGSAAVTAPPDGGSTDDARGAGPLLPWKAGNTWTYRVNDDGVVTMKTNTIMPLELVGGTGPNKDRMAYKIVTAKGVMDQTISYQDFVDDKVIRFRELSFMASTGLLELEEHWTPHKIHIDGTLAHTTRPAQWLESYKETKIPVGGTESTADARDLWTLMSESESVTVPAGTFNAVRFHKVGGDSVKNYWYVWGVGKVRETGGQLEELVDYKLMP